MMDKSVDGGAFSIGLVVLNAMGLLFQSEFSILDLS